uniref:uncharacterized protein n=1 Tax=Lonchura striata TaxID=40157 RepID=UPI000B4C88AF|nr:uncharacterized protein LOC110480619 [Lonchura striata domestica]
MARASPAAASSRLLRCQSRAAAASRSSLPCEAMVARGAGRSLRGTARRGGETPPPAPPRPAPASARPPAGRQPRHAESRPAPLRGDAAPRPPAGAGRARGASPRRAGARLYPRCRGGDGLARPRRRPDVGGAGRADPPAGGRGGAAWGAPGRRRRCGPRGARLPPPAAPSAGGGAAPGRGGRRGGERRRGVPRVPGRSGCGADRARPAVTGGVTAVPPNLRPAEGGTAGTHGAVPFTCRLKRCLPASLHPFVPPSLCPMPGRRPEPRSRRGELPAAADMRSFPREGAGKAPARQQVTSERSPRLPQAPRLLPRRPRDERDNIAAASCSSTHPSVTPVPVFQRQAGLAK